MAAITGTKNKATVLAGDLKIITITATLTSASDTITLTEATHGIGAISALLGATLTGGVDANLMGLQVSYSGLVLTVVSVGADGAAATDWTGGTVEIALLGSVNPA